MTSERLAHVHPGSVLQEEFLTPLGMTQKDLARSIGVSQQYVNFLCRGKTALSVPMALRLSRYFGTSAEFWLNLQNDYGLKEARDRYGAELEAIQPRATTKECASIVE